MLCRQHHMPHKQTSPPCRARPTGQQLTHLVRIAALTEKGGTKPISSCVSRDAVARRLLSASSWLPPGMPQAPSLWLLSRCSSSTLPAELQHTAAQCRGGKGSGHPAAGAGAGGGGSSCGSSRGAYELKMHTHSKRIRTRVGCLRQSSQAAALRVPLGFAAARQQQPARAAATRTPARCAESRCDRCRASL